VSEEGRGDHGDPGSLRSDQQLSGRSGPGWLCAEYVARYVAAREAGGLRATPSQRSNLARLARHALRQGARAARYAGAACWVRANPSGFHINGEQRFGRVVIQLAVLEQVPDHRPRDLDGGSRRCLLSFGVAVRRRRRMVQAACPNPRLTRVECAAAPAPLATRGARRQGPQPWGRYPAERALTGATSEVPPGEHFLMKSTCVQLAETCRLAVRRGGLATLR
jgi:hypothetical protein